MCEQEHSHPLSGSGQPDPRRRRPRPSSWPELVDRAAALVGEDPFERPSHSTRLAQPAIFVASMAAWRERDDDLRDVCAMAGHSLGELSALAAAGRSPSTTRSRWWFSAAG
jgi:malonyl CoA-acyl carrier protein transacylase